MIKIVVAKEINDIRHKDQMYFYIYGNGLNVFLIYVSISNYD